MTNLTNLMKDKMAAIEYQMKAKLAEIRAT